MIINYFLIILGDSEKLFKNFNELQINSTNGK